MRSVDVMSICVLINSEGHTLLIGSFVSCIVSLTVLSTRRLCHGLVWHLHQWTVTAQTGCWALCPHHCHAVHYGSSQDDGVGQGDSCEKLQRGLRAFTDGVEVWVGVFFGQAKCLWIQMLFWLYKSIRVLNYSKIEGWRKVWIRLLNNWFVQTQLDKCKFLSFDLREVCFYAVSVSWYLVSLYLDLVEVCFTLQLILVRISLLRQQEPVCGTCKANNMLLAFKNVIWHTFVTKDVLFKLN